MKKIEVARELIKIAKKLVADDFFDSFKKQALKIEIDRQKPQGFMDGNYNVSCSWESVYPNDDRFVLNVLKDKTLKNGFPYQAELYISVGGKREKLFKIKRKKSLLDVIKQAQNVLKKMIPNSFPFY